MQDACQKIFEYIGKSVEGITKTMNNRRREKNTKPQVTGEKTRERSAGLEDCKLALNKRSKKVPKLEERIQT